MQSLNVLHYARDSPGMLESGLLRDVCQLPDFSICYSGHLAAADKCPHTVHTTPAIKDPFSILQNFSCGHIHLLSLPETSSCLFLLGTS